MSCGSSLKPRPAVDDIYIYIYIGIISKAENALGQKNQSLKS